ncbi:CAP domain-containing protein [Metalysinibacillus jejuensis]|uniref:CAP and S-layer homology domain-containing protein n=1 Tax=Metalysinibacillus jejuensis TaxID=914327 RepID=UPI000D338A2F|nr:CAP domain-containing protein [Metalysinibacillus jejuensis]
MSKTRYHVQFISFAALFLLVFSYPTVAKAQIYEDVPREYWAYDAINRLVSEGYLERGSTHFEPEAFATRQEASEVIATLMDEEQEAPPLAFTDVEEDAPYYEAVKQLVAIGALQNTEHFNGDKFLRRSHVAKMVAIAANMEYETAHALTYKDVTKKTWSYNYVGAVAAADIMNGVTIYEFRPESYVTRAQLAVIMERAIQYKEHTNYSLIYDYLNKTNIDTVSNYRLWSVEIARLTNEYRAQYNLPPLRYDRSLEQIAVIKAKDMTKNNYFEHKSATYGQPWDMATIFDYKFIGYGENIARYFKTPQHTILGWINSPGHRRNMLNPNYTHIGVAIEKDKESNYYWVQHFSSK